jgi:hypothetical protein
MIELMGWIGALLGTVGSMLLALNIQVSRFGFFSYLLSNVCWIAYAALTGADSLLVMQLSNTLTSIVGVIRWFSPRWGLKRNRAVRFPRRYGRLERLMDRHFGRRRASAHGQWLR